jgi:hypothetical protein
MSVVRVKGVKGYLHLELYEIFRMLINTISNLVNRNRKYIIISVFQQTTEYFME